MDEDDGDGAPSAEAITTREASESNGSEHDGDDDPEDNDGRTLRTYRSTLDPHRVLSAMLVGVL
jgi:hypothetical protein